MNNEFFEALELLEKEKGISKDYILDKIKNAISITVKRYYNAEDNVIVEVDEKKRRFSVCLRKQVVEEVQNPATEIAVEEALEINKRAKTDGVVDIKLDPKQFGRIATQTAKHVIKQGIREAERSQIYSEFQSRQHEIITGNVLKVDLRTHNVSLEITGTEILLPKAEQIPNEEIAEGQKLKVYIVDVTTTEKGPRVKVSRTHPGFVKRLFELEVPEIYEGTVEIKSVSREAGSRTKIAVISHDENVDAVGACIGPRGTRVAGIVDELGGEKIDVVKYSENPQEFISSALSPANVLDVEIEEGEVKSCRVTVDDNQLSLAIGNKGQNARLAARLTGFKIDIKPKSGFYEPKATSEVNESDQTEEEV